MTTPLPCFLVVGPGGSGVSTAMDIFNDYGYLAISGITAAELAPLLGTLVKEATEAKQCEGVACTLKLLPGDIPAAIQETLEALRKKLPQLKILHLDAPPEILLQRYIHSEKPHLFETTLQGKTADSVAGLQQAIFTEKTLYDTLKPLKDYHVDTASATPAELRFKIGKLLGKPVVANLFTIYITSFGFKYGPPQDAELMFDMRFMTNPFYDENLRPLTGRDAPVKEFIFGLPHTQTFFEQWAALITDMLPLYQQQGKMRLTIAVGCTGGKHRSVCMAEALAKHLEKTAPQYAVTLSHREQTRWHPVSSPTPSENTPSVIPCGVGESV